jgi:hypothetical protein
LSQFELNLKKEKKKKRGKKHGRKPPAQKKLTPQNRPRGYREACCTGLVKSLTHKNYEKMCPFITVSKI